MEIIGIFIIGLILLLDDDFDFGFDPLYNNEKANDDFINIDGS